MQKFVYGNYLFIKPVLNGNMEVNPIECRKGDYFTFLFVILVLKVSIPRIIIPVQCALIVVFYNCETSEDPHRFDNG